MFNSTFLLVKNAFSNQVTNNDLTAKLFLALNALLTLIHHSWRVSFISSFSISSSLFSNISSHFIILLFKNLNAFQNLWPILCQKPGTFIFQKQLSGSDTTFTNNSHDVHFHT
jgi:hypothetical protein